MEMNDGCLFPFEWPRGSVKQWLFALGTLAAFMLVLYLILSWFGW